MPGTMDRSRTIKLRHASWTHVKLRNGAEDTLRIESTTFRKMAAGYSEQAVQRWLESIRETGMDARFIKAWRPSARVRAEAQEGDLSRYLHLR